MEDYKKETLASASSYNKKYYFNEDFSELPENIKKQIKIICVTMAEKIRGIFTLGFYKDFTISIEVSCLEDDILYDEINSKFEIDKFKKEEKEFLETLSIWYSLFNSEEGKIILREYFKNK